MTCQRDVKCFVERDEVRRGERSVVISVRVSAGENVGGEAAAECIWWDLGEGRGTV